MTIENIHLCNVSSITQEKNPFMKESEVSPLPSWSRCRAPVGGALIQNLLTSEQLPVALFLFPAPSPLPSVIVFISPPEDPLVLLLLPAAALCSSPRAAPASCCRGGPLSSISRYLFCFETPPPLQLLFRSFVLMNA